MATNDNYVKIRNDIYGGDVGKESELLRKRVEVLEFIVSVLLTENNLKKDTISVLQQEWMDSVTLEIDSYEEKVKDFLKEKKLKEIL